VKGKILSLVISLLVLPVFFLYASSNDFDSLIESLAKSNDYSGQIKILRSVNDIDSFSEKEKDRLKRALLEMTINAENTVDPGLNAALLIEANRLFPDDPRLSVKLAKAYVELGQYKQALDAQFKVLTQSGGKSDDYELTTVAHAVMGLGLMMTEYSKKAYNEFKTVIKRDPKWTGGYFLMGAYYFRAKNFKEAAKYFKKCQEINPVHGGAANMLITLKKENKI